MDVKNIKIQDFTYELPEEKIAKFPLEERDLSKLLVYKNTKISTSNYLNISGLIPENSILFFNNTRVIPARIIFTRPTGARIEVFCLEPFGELSESLTARQKTTWRCIVGNSKRWKKDENLLLSILYNEQTLTLSAALQSIDNQQYIIEFSWDNDALSFAEVIEMFGQIPLPPYLDREVEESDKERYQTIYAQNDGSVAAPTAGLHFTKRIFDRFLAKNIHAEYITLHVGAGTFKPVKTEFIADHDMHGEFFDVSKKTIELIINTLGREKIIAVGTTSLRTLESLYLMGAKSLIFPEASWADLEVQQWSAYDEAFCHQPVKAAFESLLKKMEAEQKERIVAKTQLLIAPPYQVKTIDALVTNFHQPNSTLLLLVAAWVGEDWRKIYDYALKNDFRFLSFGDGSLLMKGV
jgi:S-adenosylmethionine:tRNA ribosyltransferase-isomerase